MIKCYKNSLNDGLCAGIALQLQRFIGVQPRDDARRQKKRAALRVLPEIYTWLMILFQHLVAVGLLLSLHSSAAAPPSLAECDVAHQPNVGSIATLEACALHYRSEKLLRLLAFAHARRPSAHSAAKVQQLLVMLPSDPVLLYAAAAIYRQSGHGLWAALAMSQSALADSGTGSVAVERWVEEAAGLWEQLQLGDAAKCCDNQEPAAACLNYFSEAKKFIST